MRTAILAPAVLLVVFAGCGGDKKTQVAPPPTENTPPTALYTVEPEAEFPWTVFRFDASGSSDAEDQTSTLQIRWDWEGDGTWDTQFSETKTATHKYSTGGTKTCRLLARDGGGMTGLHSKMIEVTSPNNGSVLARGGQQLRPVQRPNPDLRLRGAYRR